jgi:hypothetical protein
VKWVQVQADDLRGLHGARSFDPARVVARTWAGLTLFCITVVGMLAHLIADMTSPLTLSF